MTVYSDYSSVMWQPCKADIDNANMTHFMRAVNARWQQDIQDFQSLHDFSVTQSEKFMRSFWDYAQIISPQSFDGEFKTDEILCYRGDDKENNTMRDAVFFPHMKINYAENMLRHTGDKPAIIFKSEGEISQTITWDELHERVAALSWYFRDNGVGEGDKVVALMPNMIETVIAFLATASVGAVWSSSSPDFGVAGVLDRFGQISPKIFITSDAYYYAGKLNGIIEKASEIGKNLPTLEKIIVMPLVKMAPNLSSFENANIVLWQDILKNHDERLLEFTHVSFNSPQFIMYSSGTTGKPKSIVHSAGGVLIKLLLEHQLHCNVKFGDRLFYFTTCGWMMWNWQITALASGATICLYDGSPFHPHRDVLFNYIDDEEINIFGVSAKYIDAYKKAGGNAKKTHELSSLKMILSTGSPLVPESFDFVYENVRGDIHLASISGGTDILGCFVGGNPILPVHRGEIQSPILGMDVKNYDEGGNIIPAGEGKRGELVCTSPFTSMPIEFYNDEGGKKYTKAYFKKFANIWCHGDYIEETINGGYIIHGRSDTTLNPGGVRIGTAEIYRQVEQFNGILESLVIGQKWDNDTRIVLFVRLSDGGHGLTESLKNDIKSHIRKNCSPRHVPAKIIAVGDIPRTRSGKITELAVRDIIHGQEINNTEAIANPSALEYFKNLTELEC